MQVLDIHSDLVGAVDSRFGEYDPARNREIAEHGVDIMGAYPGFDDLLERFGLTRAELAARYAAHGDSAVCMMLDDDGGECGQDDASCPSCESEDSGGCQQVPAAGGMAWLIMLLGAMLLLKRRKRKSTL